MAWHQDKDKEDKLLSTPRARQARTEPAVGLASPLRAADYFALQRSIGNEGVLGLINRGRGAASIQRVFTASNVSTYDDDGGHALERHGASVTEEAHKTRAKTNDPTYSSSGWATNAMMVKAVQKAHGALATWADNKTSKGKFKAKCTVNVNLAGAGFTWTYDDSTKVTTKVTTNTAVVIFSIDPNSGAVSRMTTAFPGPPAKDVNITVSA